MGDFQVKHILLGGGAIAALVLSMMSCTTVETGERGIKTTWGEISDRKPLEPGMHFVAPVGQDVTKVNVRTQKWNGKTYAYTKDVQQAKVGFTLTYNLQPQEAVAMYEQVGEDWKSQLVPQIVQRTIKDVFGQAEAVGDVINEREAVQGRIGEHISNRLAKQGISVSGFEITDVQFSDAFEKAVEAKQVAVENAQTAKNKTVEVQEKARQRIIAAEADAKAMEIKTKALTGNAKLVEYEAVQKWDGKMPQMMMGDTTPFIEVGK